MIMERLIDEISYRIRDFYYYGATREGMPCYGDDCKSIVNITDEQALAYLREKKDNAYLVRCCKWNVIRKIADFYINGLLEMVSSEWNKDYNAYSSFPPRIVKPTKKDYEIGDISSYDGYHDLKISASADGNGFDIVITVFVDDDLYVYGTGNVNRRKEKCTFAFKSTNTEVNEYILSLLRGYVESNIYLDTIKATKERIIEKLLLGIFLGELAENPYCTIDETAIRK